MSHLKITSLLDTSNKDAVYQEPEQKVGDFAFTAKVANVFDDMVSRSVPFYEEIQRMTCELAADFARSNTCLYDIGCSTATTLLALDAMVDPSVRFFGVDNSESMLAKARQKIEASQTERNIELITADIHQGVMIENASVVTMLLTLQFARPLHRQRIMQRIFQGLNEQGALILVEKLTSEDTLFNRLFIGHYYDFKRRNGYSETEIAQKREALENVLIPYRLEENVELLKSSGFRSVECFFRWYNFCGVVALK
jgi:tRNA (cmo5U34)-methyltransferase